MRSPLLRVRLWDGSTPWLVTRHAEQRALLADPRVSADVARPGFPTARPSSGSGLSFITKDDPEHARLRRPVTGAFTARRVEALRPVVRRIVDERIDELVAGPRPADLVATFALPVPSLVICELLGVPYGDHAFFHEQATILNTATVTPSQRGQAAAALNDYLRQLVVRKPSALGGDLLSGLAGPIEAGELSVDEAAEIGVLLLLAGHETTASMIALGTALLFKHPEQLAVIRDAEDSAVVASAVEELLRYLTISHTGLRRLVLADIEIDGQVIRAGEGIVIPNDIGNRDPDAFPEPDRLDLRRNPRHHLAFGFGVHQCLGQPLARMELHIVYSTLFRRIPTLRLAADVERLPFKHDGLAYGLHELPVTW